MTARIRLSVIDRAFLLAETRETPMHVGGLQIFKVPPGASPRFVSTLAAKLRTYPVSVSPLNYRLTGGFAGTVMPSWEVVDDVDLDYHFRHSALPHPGGERELGMLVSRLHSNPMDLSRPLWEYHLIEGLADHRFAVYTKLHHAMVDGAGAMRLVNLATDPIASFAPPFWADVSKQPQESSSRSNGLLGWLPATIQDEVMSLPSLVRGLATTAQTALGVAAEADLTSIIEAPRTMLNVRIDGQRRVATYSASLQRVKAIGEAAGGTINDVVLAACSGALRRYLAERDALPQQSLVAAVPVALHHDAGAAAGNAVTCLNARLGTDVDDVRQRFGVIMSLDCGGQGATQGHDADGGNALRLAAQLADDAELAAGGRQADGTAVEPVRLERSRFARAAVFPRRRDGGALPGLAGQPRHGTQHHRAELCRWTVFRVRGLCRQRAECSAPVRPHGRSAGRTRDGIRRGRAAASRRQGSQCSQGVARQAAAGVAGQDRREATPAPLSHAHSRALTRKPQPQRLIYRGG